MSEEATKAETAEKSNEEALDKTWAKMDARDDERHQRACDRDAAKMKDVLDHEFSKARIPQRDVEQRHAMIRMEHDRVTRLAMFMMARLPKQRYSYTEAKEIIGDYLSAARDAAGGV